MSDDPNQPTEVITSIKGFDADLRCRGFQFEIGGRYTAEGPIATCENGFHAISGYPLEVFDYYPPASSRYCEVEQSGALGRHLSDSKIASASISVKFEISLSDLIARAVKWVFDRAISEGDGSSATGYSGAASATGDRGAASATGARGAASATGYSGAASATGARGAASATGYSGVALSIGVDARAMATDSNAICLVHRDEKTGDIVAIAATKVGEQGVESGKWYTLSRDGAFVEIVDEDA